MVPHTSWGTRRKVRTPSRQRKARALSRRARHAVRKKDAWALSCRPSWSFCPNRMENTAPLPIHSPNKMDVRKVIKVKEEPTAAKAFLPRYFPTIKVSATL